MSSCFKSRAELNKSCIFAQNMKGTVFPDTEINDRESYALLE